MAPARTCRHEFLSTFHRFARNLLSARDPSSAVSFHSTRLRFGQVSAKAKQFASCRHESLTRFHRFARNLLSARDPSSAVSFHSTRLRFGQVSAKAKQFAFAYLVRPPGLEPGTARV